MDMGERHSTRLLGNGIVENRGHLRLRAVQVLAEAWIRVVPGDHIMSADYVMPASSGIPSTWSPVVTEVGVETKDGLTRLG
jgi:hypothetical protein